MNALSMRPPAPAIVIADSLVGAVAHPTAASITRRWMQIHKYFNTYQCIRYAILPHATSTAQGAIDLHAWARSIEPPCALQLRAAHWPLSEQVNLHARVMKTRHRANIRKLSTVVHCTVVQYTEVRYCQTSHRNHVGSDTRQDSMKARASTRCFGCCERCLQPVAGRQQGAGLSGLTSLPQHAGSMYKDPTLHACKRVPRQPTTHVNCVTHMVRKTFDNLLAMFRQYRFIAVCSTVSRNRTHCARVLT
ncbi:hypothetical protein COO60DRAFT_1096682 [Scenedesmus sp. NREL 46B-D3]|nr:hypothetical protein COO60DRAFT_1096682 [Scenedesmus sp. NREL 46B-D3]